MLKPCGFVLLLLTLLAGCATHPAQPVAHRGVLYQRSFDFSGSAPRLSGEWEFYWQQLVPPDSFSKPSCYPKTPLYLAVPGPWKDVRAGRGDSILLT